MMRRHLLAFLTIFFWTRVGVVSAGQNPLEGRSFTIRSIVTSIYTDRDSVVNHVHESYSADQHRAKFDFKFIQTGTKNQPSGKDDSVPDMGTIYLDTTSEHAAAIILDGTNLRCRETDEVEMSKVFGLDPYDAEDPAAEKYIMGPARLLFFISKHRDRMKLASLDEHVEVHNLACVMYTLEHSFNGKTFNFSAYYSTAALAADQQALPLEIIIENLDQDYKRTQLATIVDYSKVVWLASDTAAGSSLSGNVRQVTHDKFVFEPVAGCSNALFKRQEDLFSTLLPKQTQFSFKASIEVDSRQPIQSYVAYDGRLDSLRFDLLSRDSEYVSGLKKQVFNLKLNRMYHTMERASRGSLTKTTVDQILEMTADDEDSDAKSRTFQCSIAKLLPSQRQHSDGNVFSIGRLLVGSEAFVYMGRAKVRGIEALVYESHSGSSPFWLEQPVVYKTSSSSEEKQRDPDKGMRLANNDDVVLTSLLYVAEHDPKNSPLLLELFQINTKNLIFLGAVSVNFYDFNWGLDQQAPDGDRPAEQFSLEDLCSSGLGNNQYERIDLVLERDRNPNQGDDDASLKPPVGLTKPDQRNAALVASLQESFLLPATMIYDLESRFKTAPVKAQGITPVTNSVKEQLIVSFRVAQHGERLAELFYLGQGVPKLYAQDLMSNYVRSFQACYLLASHIRTGVYFGFNPSTRICTISKRAAPSKWIKSDKEESPPSFIMNQKESTEIYRIAQSIDMGQRASRWIKDMYHTYYQLTLIGRRFFLRSLRGGSTDGANDEIEFTLARLNVDERDYRTSVANNNKKNEEKIDTSRLNGFGLPLGVPGNRPVRAAPLNLGKWGQVSEKLSGEQGASAMTHDQCQTACLTNPDCQSYSTCIKGGLEMECVISTNNFRSLKVVEQLRALSEQETKIGSKHTVKITLDGEQNGIETELIRHPNCQLYNLIYLNFFDRPWISWNTVKNRYIYTTDSEEECAQAFVRHNLKLIRQDVRKTAQALASHDFISGDISTLQRTVSEHKKSSSQIPTSFSYISRTYLSSKSAKLAKAIESRAKSPVEGGEKLDPDLVEGYCVFSKPMYESELTSDQGDEQELPEEAQGYIRLEMFRYRYDLLYERQYGVGLKSTQLSTAEFEAYRRLEAESSERIDASMFERLWYLIESGANFQTDIMVSDVQNCAQFCFKQSQGPWPACRSFELVLNLGATRRYSCRLNSITLSQAVASQRYDLIDDSSQLEVWHYEPRAGFALDESTLEGELRLAQDNALEQLGASLSIRIHAFAIFMIVLISLASGLVLGVRLGDRYLIKEETRRQLNQDRASLVVTEPTKIEFKNLVDHEGLITDNNNS